MTYIFRFLPLYILATAVAAQEGRKFLLAFPPSYNLATDGLCQIIINTHQDAEVNITLNGYSEKITVNTQSYIHDVECTIRATTGLSNNGIIVTSDVDITVQVYNDWDGKGDAYLVLPSEDMLPGKEYILATTSKPYPGFPVSSMFLIAAEYDNTLVQLFAPASGGYSLNYTITLDSLDTYVTNIDTGEDFTGWKIRSDKSISVVTGTALNRVNVEESCTDGNAGYVFMPSTDQAGYRFVVPKIAKRSPGDSGAYIRVISFSQSNFIQIPEHFIQEVLQSGEYYEHKIDQWDQITRVDCREPCITVLYNEVKCDSGEGNFLMFVTPIHHSTTFSQFTVIERTQNHNLDSFITIVADSEDIRFDDTPIGSWREISPWSLYEVSLSVSYGSHTLHSSEGGTFVAFVYGHTPGNSYGYGSTLVHDVSSLPPPTTTTERPELPGTVPSYRISLISDWISEGTMDSVCVSQYSNQLLQKTVQMGVDINSMIGDTFCETLHSTEISVTSSSSQFFAFNNSGNAFASFLITPEGYISFGDVLSCAHEITEYTKTHINWGEPLLDSIQDCTYPVFEDGVFYDGLHEWICMNVNENEEESTTPSTYIDLEDLADTHDNSDLTPECTFIYGRSLDQKSLSMRSTINALLGNQLCAGVNGISVISHVSSFTAQGKAAMVKIYFVLQHDIIVSGNEALICSEEVMQFVSIYGNWDYPLLPPETGCPDIIFQEESFIDSTYGWLCTQ